MITELPRMNDRQFRNAKSLIGAICCNYDRQTCGCIKLDRGDIVLCPQILTKSVCCRYFRDILLEDPDGRALKSELFQDEGTKRCTECGSLFQPKSNRSKYCSACAKKIRLQKQRQYMANKRLGV